MDPVRERYRGQAGAAYHLGHRGIPDESYPWVARDRGAKLGRFISPTDELLEYGVGWGWNLAFLDCARKLGYDVERSLAPRLAEHGIEYVDATQTLRDGCVNVVLCHHTLEHCLHPAQELTEMLRLLRPGGRLLLIVPFETARRFRSYNPNAPGHHLYAWTTQHLGNLVSAVGFQVRHAQVALYGYDRFSACLASKLRWGETGYKILSRIGRRLVPLWEIIIVAAK